MQHHLLDTIICELQIPQKPLNQTKYIKSNNLSDDGLNNSIEIELGTIVELTRQNVIALKVLNTYRLLPLKVITEYSLMASILTLIKRNFVELSWTEQITLIESYGKQTPSDITKLLGINIIIWSANQIELFCHEVGKYDHPTILIFQNKYGQYYPIVNNSNIHELNNSPLLLKLLSIHFMKLDTK